MNITVHNHRGARIEINGRTAVIYERMTNTALKAVGGSSASDSLGNAFEAIDEIIKNNSSIKVAFNG
jgi:hypothetical protein